MAVSHASDAPAPIGADAAAKQDVAPAQLGAPAAALLGFATLACVNVAAIFALVPAAPDPSIRVWNILYEAGQYVGIGLLVAGIVWLWRRYVRSRGLLDYAPLAAAVVGLGLLTLSGDLENMVSHVQIGHWRTVALVAVVSASSLSVPVAALVGRWLARPFLRWLPIVLAIAAFAVNNVILPNDYPAVHLFISLAGVALLAGAATGARVGVLQHGGRARALVGRGGIGVLALASAYTLFTWPRNDVLVQMLKLNGSAIMPFLARLRANVRAGSADVPLRSREWFIDRKSLPPVPPHTEKLLPERPIVLFMTIDAVRADVIASHTHDAQLPELARLRDESVYFTHCWSPGAQTVYTLSAVFAGKYFSQMYWSPMEKGGDLWPHADETTRFPEFLSRAGVPTVIYGARLWFVNKWGVVGGFHEQHVVHDRYGFARWFKVGNGIMGRLKRQKQGPLFLYTHFLDPHAPYDRAGRKGTPFHRYLGEIGLVDKEIGKIRATLRTTGLAKRTTLIVSSDHGEAFGEHGSHFHGTTLYEPEVRVPLMIHIPGGKPRVVDDHVSLIDIGPTILDLFNVATPSHMMGQSLEPYLRGGKPKLTRPIVIEGRLKKALVMDDNYKVIVDDRRHTTEVYNLSKDPDEEHNLYKGPGMNKDLDRRVALLRRFFEVHTLERSGYKVPYRP